MKPVLRVQDLAKAYRPGGPAVAGVSFAVAPGEIFALLGPSGSGKTTTLRLIAGFERPDRGEVWIAGRQASGGGRFLPPEERGVGFVFQDHALFPHLTVLENVMFGLHRRPPRRRRARALEVLDLVGLTVFKDRRPDELSGGQQQRVALARAIAPGPPLVLLDEAFSSLDAGLREATRAEVRALLKATGTSAVLVTHDQEEALSFADRLGVMRAGRLVQVGTPEEVYHLPATPFVARFLGHTNLVPARAHGDWAETPLGRVPLARPAEGAVRLSIRPEHLELLPPQAAEGVPGRVRSRAFKGHDLTLEVEAAGRRYRVQADYRSRFFPGDPVRVRVREPAVAVGRSAEAEPPGVKRERAAD